MPLSVTRWINIPIMLQKVRRWNGNNQISSCLLPALTSIISFCRLPTASTVAKRQRGANAAPPQPPGRPERTDARCQAKKEAWGEKNLHKGGVGKADLVPGRAPAWKRRLRGSPSAARGLEAVGDAKARLAKLPLTPPLCLRYVGAPCC